MIKLFTTATMALILTASCKSGLVTMTNGCYNKVAAAEDANKAGNYTAALEGFTYVLEKCNAYDAKEKAYAGKAKALNGLKQYEAAYEAAMLGNKIKQNSVPVLFEQAVAELGMNKKQAAKNTFTQLIDITKRNQNVAERAILIAKVAEINTQLGNFNDAQQYIDDAITANPNNIDFYLLKADAYNANNEFLNAYKTLQTVQKKFSNNTNIVTAKVQTVVKQYQQKYNVSTMQALGKKLSNDEKSKVCAEIVAGKKAGMKDINIDLLQLEICK